MEQFVLRLAAAQRRAGHVVSVLALRSGPLEEAAQADGITTRVLGKSNSLARFVTGVAAVVSSRPDIIHAHNPTSLHYACGAKMFCGARVVLTDHGQCAGVVRVPRRWEARRVDALVSVSEDVGVRHQNIFPSSAYTVIRNGLEFAPPSGKQSSVLRELNLQSGPTLIVVARVEPVKDHESLLRALALLKRRGIVVNTLVVGDGSERRRLEALLPDLDLDAGRVRFLGFRHDVTDLLHAADIFVLPSIQEGLPLALLEAMAQGLPVVATAVGGVPEVITHGVNGMLCPPQTPELLAEALAELIGNPELSRRLGQAGSARVTAAFSFSDMVSQYEELYRTLLLPGN